MNIVPERIEEVLNGDLYSLPAAFHWADSAEGHKYWSAIFMEKKVLDKARKRLIGFLLSERDVLIPNS